MTRKKHNKPAAVIHYTPKPFTGVDWTTSLLRPPVAKITCNTPAAEVMNWCRITTAL